MYINHSENQIGNWVSVKKRQAKPRAWLYSKLHVVLFFKRFSHIYKHVYDFYHHKMIMSRLRYVNPYLIQFKNHTLSHKKKSKIRNSSEVLIYSVFLSPRPPVLEKVFAIQNCRSVDNLKFTNIFL